MAIAMLSSLVSRVRRAVNRARYKRFKGVPAIRPELLVDSPGAAIEREHLAPWKFPESADDSRPAAQLDSKLCVTADLESPAFRYWARQIHEEFRYHRKLWEFCFICQALYERGMLRDGMRGLGFAVGQEPLPSLFASLGATIVASDLPQEDPRVTPWKNTQQWTDGLEPLNARDICPADLFRQRVTFRGVDMNRIPDDLTGFDFTWSSCSFEHCGNLQLGAKFLRNQMRCLKPGGWAVHTTEFNLTSNKATLDEGPTVVFRRRDIEQMIADLRADGHYVEPLNLTLGDGPLDQLVDCPPYSQERHLRLQLGMWASTSIGLIIRHKS